MKKGYVLNNDGKLTVNVSVFTKTDCESFMKSLEKTVNVVEENAIKIMNEAAKIIKSCIPVHLKSFASQMAYFRVFEDAVSMTVGKMVENKVLYPYNGAGVLPTTYVLLNE